MGIQQIHALKYVNDYLKEHVPYGKNYMMSGKNMKQIPERRKKNEESMKVYILNIFYANSNMQSSVKDLQ